MSKYRKIDDKDFYIVGEIHGNVSNANTLYGEAKLNGARGHGFAAERANYLNDLLHGRNAILKGDDFVKNGADRIVDGVNIQSNIAAVAQNALVNVLKMKDLDMLILMEHLCK